MGVGWVDVGNRHGKGSAVMQLQAAQPVWLLVRGHKAIGMGSVCLTQSMFLLA